MKKFTISDFSGGMVERTSPDDYRTGEVGRMFGFIPEDDQSIRTQWGIQSIGYGNAEDLTWGIDWSGTNNNNNAHLTSVYPIRGADGVFLVALKDDGSIWWCKAPSGQATFDEIDISSPLMWTELSGLPAQNQGYDQDLSFDVQPEILIERNPDYRFICELPFEIYKYIKQAKSGNVSEFDKDEISDTQGFDESGFPTNNYSGAPRSITSGVLIHSRRYYHDGKLTRGVDINTIKNVTNAVATKNTATTPDTMTCTLTINSHGYNVGDTLKVNLNDTIVGVTQLTFNGTFYITAKTTNTVTYTYLKDGISAYTSAAVTGTASTVSRKQTAVVCYVDPTELNDLTDEYGVVKAVTFPNIRRWPIKTVSGTGYAAVTAPMNSWAVTSSKAQGEYPFILTYPFGTGSILNTADPLSFTSAYPKDTSVFHPYTYLDKDKFMLPGSGFIPRGNIGTMFGNHLIIGDIEWREDSSAAVLNDKKITPTANTAAMATQYSSFGLRDGNTEPHRGYFYYSEFEIDKFDPRSVIRASGTDTRIAGMHSINNRLVTITTSGGQSDGVIAFAGNLSQLHPYTPGVLANPLAFRKEVVRGGVGTADAEDSYNHGNPQTCLWPEFGRVAFIDKTGYVFVTDGASCTLLDERYPIKGRPVVSTVNDHVASVGKHLFILKDGHLFCYTSINGKGAWSILKRPQAFWQVKPDSGIFLQYNVIKSMRGIGNELYFVVHSYYQNADANYLPLAGSVPILATSRVMRYALNGPSTERGRQDNIQLDGLEIETPAIGMSSQTINTNWNMVGVNFHTEAGCTVNGVKVTATSPGADGNPVTYQKGYLVDANPTLDASYLPIYGTDLGVFTNGFHAYDMPAGVGPQHVITARFSFRGDVKVEGINIWYTGSTEIKGGL